VQKGVLTQKDGCCMDAGKTGDCFKKKHFELNWSLNRRFGVGEKEHRSDINTVRSKTLISS